MLESSVQRRIIRQKEAEGYLVIKVLRANMSGLPDLLCIKDGKATWVEVKVSGKKPTLLQLARHELLRSHGCEVEVTSQPIEQ